MPWYKKWWGVLIIVSGVLLLGVAIIFFSLTVHFLKQFKAGNSPLLKGGASSGFTAVNTGVVAKDTQLKRTDLESVDEPTLGVPNAEVVLVEFIDYKCPNCRTVAPTVKRIAAEYGHKVKIIVRDFPIESIHPGTTNLARLAYCAQQSDGYWPVHDLLFNLQDQLAANLTDSSLASLAATTGLNKATIEVCLASGAALQEVQQDFKDGLRFGVNGTPTFFVNGDKVEGAVPYPVWQAFFESLFESL